MPCSICLSLSDLFHAAQYSVGPSTFLQMSKFLPFYGWIIFHSGCVYIRLVCTWWALGLLSCLGYCKWCKPESFLSLEQLSSARGRRSCWIISVPNILHMCVSCCNWIILHKLLIFSNDFTLSHCQNLYMPMFSFWNSERICSVNSALCVWTSKTNVILSEISVPYVVEVNGESRPTHISMWRAFPHAFSFSSFHICWGTFFWGLALNLSWCFYLLFNVIQDESYLSSGCHNKYYRLGGLNNRNLFLTVLKVGRSKIEVPVEFWCRLSPWLANILAFHVFCLPSTLDLW